MVEDKKTTKTNTEEKVSASSRKGLRRKDKSTSRVDGDDVSDQYRRFSTVLPLCCLFSMVTAAIIAVVLAFTFANIRQEYSLMSAADYKGDLARDVDANKRDRDNLIMLSAGGAIDWLYNTEANGFIYVDSLGCGDICNYWNVEIGSQIAKKEGLDVFHYIATNINDKRSDDARVSELLLDDYEAPALLYVRNGRVFDRVDNFDEASVETFLRKYAAPRS